jgi:capsular exopolysaccharide synthesis family protein
MTAELSTRPLEPPPADLSGTPIVHTLLRFVLAVRFHRNLVLAVMASSLLLGGVYFLTAPRYYSAKAQVQISQSADPTEKTSNTEDESVRRNTIPTFESVFLSARVIQGALAHLPPTDRIDLEGVPESQWVEAIQEHLTARAIRSTSIIEVGYRSKSPTVAVNVVNAVVQSFLDFNEEMPRGTAQDNLGLLMEEQKNTARKLGLTQAALLAARRGCDMAFHGDAKTLPFWEQRVVYFNDALIGVQKERMELQAAMASIQAARASGQGLGQQVLTLGDALGRELLANILGVSATESNGQATLQQNLLNDQANLTMLQQHLGPAHPSVINLRERIHLEQDWLRANQERVCRSAADLDTTRLGPWLVEILQQRLRQFQDKESLLKQQFEEARAEAKNVGGQLAQVEVLQREEEQINRWNEKLQDRIAELSVTQKGQEIRTAVIQEPAIPTKPSWPKLTYVAMMALLGGFGVALALVHALDLLDDRFNSQEELQLRLGMPVLAMIPELKPAEGVGVESLPMYAHSTAVGNEAFRTLRTALSLIHEGARQIVVTSPEPEDGKTTILANLAVSYALSEKKTLVIDADLRRPGMTRLMDMPGATGLSELIRGEGDIGQLAAKHIRTSQVKGLDVLPSGPRSSNPAELLASPRFSQLLAWAASAYDQVFVDAPPMTAASDAAAVGRLVDGMILVMRPAKNRRRLIVRVVEGLRTLKLPVLGVVINRVGSKEERGYYGYHESGYSGYGYGYGYGYAHRYADDKETLIVPMRTKAG